jgi:hypothetical protein
MPDAGSATTSQAVQAGRTPADRCEVASESTGAHLRAAACRIIRSLSEADDAVQEARRRRSWLPLRDAEAHRRATNRRGLAWPPRATWPPDMATWRGTEVRVTKCKVELLAVRT